MAKDEPNWLGNLINTLIFVIIGEVCMGLNLIMNILAAPEAMPELVLGLDMLPG